MTGDHAVARSFGQTAGHRPAWVLTRYRGKWGHSPLVAIREGDRVSLALTGQQSIANK
jgi:hypothetical protein